jgi:hypothetical protein
MRTLFLLLVSTVVSSFSARLDAGEIFSDEFNNPGSSSTSGWYVRGENIEEGKNVEKGNLRLARKDREKAVPRNSGVWKSFPTVSLNEGESLRLTVVFSGAEVDSAPFFRVVVADSPNVIDGNGDVLSEPAPRFIYALGLPSGDFDRPEDQDNLGFFEATTENQISGTPFVTPNLTSFSAPSQIKPVFPGPRKVLTNGSYGSKAVLVWELHNKGGVILGKGSWTGPEGEKTDFLDVSAEVIQHFEFNKIGFGFMVWDADWADGKHLAESVLIDSVKLEKF